MARSAGYLPSGFFFMIDRGEMTPQKQLEQTFEARSSMPASLAVRHRRRVYPSRDALCTWRPNRKAIGFCFRPGECLRTA